jgi:NAD(P)-dependent dehydrogenase (short-subunit alcohol dehydrogenase family)
VKNRTCIVTGASSGIGRATAVALARTGARIGLVCRDPARGDTARGEIVRETGNADVSVFLADLAVQSEIRRVAAELLDAYPAIHLLVNNAGVVNLRYAETPDGIEATFAVNHLAYFLLTHLLLDRIRASAPARIVNVASEAHKIGRIDLDDLGHRRRYRPMRVYGASKLANILFTYELARRLEGSGVTVNCVHPGAVATRLGHNNGRVAAFLARTLGVFFRTPEDGAATSIWAATAPELDAVSGRYFANCREARSSRASHDAALARALWAASEQLIHPTRDTSRVGDGREGEAS